MRKEHLGRALSVFAFCSTLFADQVVLKNGDRLTGTIAKSDDKILLIKTEFAGDVTDSVAGRARDQLHAAVARDLANGKTVAGPVTTADGSLAVTTATSGTVTVVEI